MTQPSRVSFQKYAKILTILRKRTQQQTNSKTCWPTQSSFKLLNNIDSTPSAPPTPITIRKTYIRAPKFATFTAGTPILYLSRPSTCATEQRGRTASPNGRKYQQKTLFESIREEKLVRLRQEKEELMATIFNSDKVQIHRIDEDEQIANKANSINFKTYHSLNKLMNLQEKINQTVNLRPKTSCSQLRKKTRCI